MTEMSPAIREMFEDFYREKNLEDHRIRKSEWPWYGLFQHWLFVSWRCPACKELKRRGAEGRNAE